MQLLYALSLSGALLSTQSMLEAVNTSDSDHFAQMG